mgnify:CR=1 FL=1
MKRLLLVFLLSFLGVGIINAQSPDMFSYQAVARDDQGNVISSQDVGIKISILQGSATGTVVYAEEHSKTTNGQGLVNLMIGNGSVTSGTFSNIDWSSGPYFVKVELDETGGTSYSTMGTSQLLSVPYAKYAESSANTFSGDYQDLANKPDLSDTASYDDYWMNKGDTVYIMDSKVGIGTDSLSGNLTVQGTGTPHDLTIRDNNAFLNIDGMSHNAGIVFSSNGTEEAFFFFDPLSSNMRLSSPGNFGINTSYPEEQLDVNGAVRVGDTTVNPEPRTVYANSTPIAYGEIGSYGSVYSGSYGIASVNKVATGEYDITLRNGFSEYATVSITTFDSGSPEIATYASNSDTNLITVNIWDMTSSRTNSRFSIIVYGLPEGAKKKKKSEMKTNKNRTGVSQD